MLEDRSKGVHFRLREGQSYLDLLLRASILVPDLYYLLRLCA